MEITSAEFVISNTDVKKCPAGTFPEYAFIGRSNVGKSSLINMLTARKGLAMTSATPGKTMLINHFLINKNWYLVDLPGYGYARRGQKGKDQIRTIIEDYILEREQMTNLFLLIDSRLEPQKIDLEFMEWLGENGIPFSIIFTKADKLKSGRLKMNINACLLYTSSFGINYLILKKQQNQFKTMESINAVITGVGGYVPDYILTNDEISKMVDTTDEWIMGRIGIKAVSYTHLNKNGHRKLCSGSKKDPSVE